MCLFIPASVSQSIICAYRVMFCSGLNRFLTHKHVYFRVVFAIETYICFQVHTAFISVDFALIVQCVYADLKKNVCCTL